MRLCFCIPLALTISITASADSWKWNITRGGRGPDRIFYFLSSGSTPSKKIETWEIQMPPSQAPTSPAGGKVTWTRTPIGKTGLTQVVSTPWLIQRSPPLLPQSSERIDCWVHLPAFTAPLKALCSAAPGGPLQIPPGPLWIRVREDPKGSSLQITNDLITLMTAGLVIPDSSPNDDIAFLESFSAPDIPSVSPQLKKQIQAFWKSPTPRTLAPLAVTRGVFPLELATTLISGVQNQPLHKAATLLMPLLPEPSARWVLIRVALQTLRDTTEILRLAHSIREFFPAGTPCPQCQELRVQALQTLRPNQAQAFETLLASGAPALEFLTSGASTPPLDDRAQRSLLKSLAALPRLSEVEIRILIEYFLPFDETKLLKVALPKLPEPQRDIILLERLETPGSRMGSDFLGTQMMSMRRLAKSPALRDRVLKSNPLDEGKANLAKVLLNSASPEDVRAIHASALRAFNFDETRLTWIQQHPDWISALSASEREKLLEHFVFEKEQARKALKLD